MQWFRDNVGMFLLYGGTGVLMIVGLMWWVQGREESRPEEAVIPNESRVDRVAEESQIKSRIPAASFRSISATELSGMLEEKDFTLIDVHIPEQVHIPNTDYQIPYNDIETLAAAVPEKNAKVVLYCRSGGMSKVAARALAERGYTNVYDLNGGMIEWKEKELPTLPRGSVPLFTP